MNKLCKVVSMNNKVDILTKFIFEDKVHKKLLNLNSCVMEYNVLEITGMGSQEIKHSNVLSWIFGDNQHNVKYAVLNNFLKKVLNNKLEHNLYSYILNKEKALSIYREENGIDLLIVDANNKVVIAIENKVFAQERTEGSDGGQLRKYEKFIAKKYDKYDKYFIYLTIDLEKASRNNWLCANYEMITDSISDILKEQDTSEKTKIIFESYIDLLKRKNIVKDEKLKELCENFWSNKEYVDAINILLDYRITPLRNLYSILQEELKFYDNSPFVALESIKKLYKLIGEDWYISKEVFFELQISYHGGKDERIWIGFYRDQVTNPNEKFTKICNMLVDNSRQKSITILKVDNKYLLNKDIDSVVKEIKTKIYEYDKTLNKLLENYENLTHK